MIPVVCVALWACSGDGGERDTASGGCSVQADVTGAVALTFTGQDDAACAIQHSFDNGLDVRFIHVNASGSLDLSISDVMEGETGGDYRTRVSVTNDDNARWQSDACLASIDEHRLLDTEASEIGELRHYDVTGRGSCPAALQPVSAGANETTVSSFRFQVRFTWRD
jgi:hypothetical protein